MYLQSTKNTNVKFKEISMSIFAISDKVIAVNKAQRYMDPGVHENVELVDVKFETTANGNIYLAYYWKNEYGQEVSKTEYEVKTTGNKPFAQLNEKEKETYLSLVQSQMRRVLYVAKQFVPEEEFKGKEFNTFKEFAQFVKSKLAPNTYTGVKLRIKVTYDKNGWVTVPSYVREVTNPWIERMDRVASDKTIMAIDSTIDKTTRTTAGQVPNSKPSPFATDAIVDKRDLRPFGDTTSQTNGDLPF